MHVSFVNFHAFRCYFIYLCQSMFFPQSSNIWLNLCFFFVYSVFLVVIFLYLCQSVLTILWLNYLL